MRRLSRTLVIGPLEPYADGFRCQLAGLGYPPGSLERQVKVMNRLSWWLADAGLDVGELDSLRAEQFLAALRAGKGRRLPTQRTLAPLLGWLRQQGLVPQPTTVAVRSPIDELLERYRGWLVDHRGLAARTIDRYQATARRFCGQRAAAGGGHSGVSGLSGADVTAFLLQECSRLAVGSAKGRVAELRSLLRFLHLEGFTEMALAAAVPPVAGWHDTGLPATLSGSQVQALLASCDRSTVTGRRDFAILMLLARLGLRAAEAAGLQLGDVDWRAGQIAIRGKTRRDDFLPLLADVGGALVAYLRDGRPAAECRAVFLTRYAPLRAMHSTTVSHVVKLACLRAGLAPVGAHRLRHALATELLREGSGLVEIAQVLRHRDLGTTAVYAKCDRDALREVARPWPTVNR